MAAKLYSYCMSKPYAWTKGNAEDVRITVKKTALNFALEMGEDITEVFNVVDTVTKMIGGKLC